jgi:hypothetical protein
MKDSTIIKLCFAIFLIGTLTLMLITSTLETPKTAIIQKINSNAKVLNITINMNNKPYSLFTFQKAPLSIKEGDYIQIQGTIENNMITPKKISKLMISTK